jgi:sugar phosphate isomerase/epimerase
MRLPAPGAPHLTYCTNIHPGERWAEVRENVARHVAAVKARVAPDEPFGVGLRLSARAAAELTAPAALEDFRALLADAGLYVFTINGFPHGTFHGVAVKEKVYLPDWLDDERLAYSDTLAALLAALLPDGLDGTVSTVPGAFKPRVRGAADVAAMSDRLVRHAAALWRLRERSGKTIALALEPEPCCHLETVAETVAFFETSLFAAPAVARLAALTGLARPDAEAALRRHLGVCFDACHMAVEYEDAGDALAALADAGIAIGKIQVSAGLEVTLDGADDPLAAALAPFAEGVYLHQVVERRAGSPLLRHLDLPDALAALRSSRGAREWRIHFHVPLFLERLGAFRNTQPYLRDLLGRVRATAPTAHLEVETYTWDVLPEEHRRLAIDDAIARELTWVRDQLCP